MKDPQFRKIYSKFLKTHDKFQSDLEKSRKKAKELGMIK